jgi:hypothetical protein
MTYNEKIVDISTGEETIRPYTADEIKAVETAQAKSAAELAEFEADQKAKQATRKAISDKLGLTADEMAALLA